MQRREVLAPSEPSLGEIAHSKITALCSALDLPERECERILHTFNELSQPWSTWPAGDEPLWQSDISDDGTPFEFSVAFDGGEPKLRLLVEAQSAAHSSVSRFEAALALNQRLAEEGKVDLRVFSRIVDLFAPTHADARFQLWHAVELGRKSVLYKAYLNPQVLGPGAAPELVREALQRLGMEDAWEHLSPHVTGTADRAALRYLSVDLVSEESARVKIYLGRSRAEEVEELFEGLWPAGQATQRLEELTGFSGPYEARPVLTCFAYRKGTATPEVTLHVPVRCYAPSDADSVDRAAAFLNRDDADRFTRALRAVADRPLRSGRGLLTYVSLRESEAGLRVTTYIAPEVYAIGASRRTASNGEVSESRIRVRLPESTTLGDIQELITRRRRLISEHPFLRSLEGEGSLEEVRRFVPKLSFFVMSFQDVLRLAREKCVEPDMRTIARTHELEDKGHDRWFLEDLQQLGLSFGMENLFSSEHQLTRDVGYALVTEVIHASDDRTRIAVALSLEAIGAEFFDRVIGFLERIGADEGLQYFARKHQAIESAHEVFEEHAQLWLSAIEIPAHALGEVIAGIDKTFEVMTLLADDLQTAFRRSIPPARV